MSDRDTTMTLRIAGGIGGEDSLLASTFSAALSEWVDFISRIGRDVISSRKTVEWTLTDLQTGSAVLTLTAVPLAPEGRLVGSEVTRRSIRSLGEFERGGRLPDLSPKAAEHFRRFIKIVSDGSIQRVEVTSALGHAVLSPMEFSSHRPTPLIYRALGSIEGTLVSVSFAYNPSFTVRERITDQLVPCYFDEDTLSGKVIDNLRRRVLVGGVVASRTNGDLLHVTDVDELRTFPEPHDTLRPADLGGILPRFTDGATAEQWIGERRA
jgi:hypothetical protein